MVMNPAHAIDEPGEPFGARRPHGHGLSLGTRLREYEITGLIGEGAFGIVYLAWDDALQRQVAIKEYLPAAMASRVAGASAVVVQSDRDVDTFKAGLKSFVSEARLLARFDHASLVKVYRFWEENGTAYMVMPFYEGPTLQTALAELSHVPGEAELRTWLKPILNAVSLLHEGGLWHQNVSPDGIVLTPVGPVLLGFGAAEKTITALHHTPAASLKAGFAAIEQYGSAAETKRGAWTDLYALAAVIRAAITGNAPAPATDRLGEDPARPLSVIAAGLYSERFLAAIDAALAVEPERRPRDHLQFRSLMGDIDAPEPVALAPPRDLMHEPFVGAKAGEREITVPDRPLMSLGDPAAKPGPRLATPAVAAKPVAAERARATAHAGTENMPPRPAEGVPSWMGGGAGRHRFGRRAVYGLVAGTGALIGIAALALQFYARQTGHAGSVALVSAPSVIATPGRPASQAVATVAGRALAGAEGLAPAAALPAAPASASSVAPQPAPIRAGQSANAPGARPAASGDLTERQARCTEILQKASLERITAAETSFFKKECK